VISKIVKTGLDSPYSAFLGIFLSGLGLLGIGLVTRLQSVFVILFIPWIGARTFALLGIWTVAKPALNRFRLTMDQVCIENVRGP